MLNSKYLYIAFLSLNSIVSGFRIQTGSRIQRHYSHNPRIINVPLNDFYKNIDENKIDELSVSDDFKHIYYKESVPANEVDEYDKTNPRDPVSQDNVFLFKSVNANPLLTDKIVDYANKKDIKFSFISVPSNPISQIGATLTNSFDFLFMSFFLFLIGRTALSFFIGGGGGSMPFSGGNRGGPFGQVGIVNDKETMKNENITLSSWAGSPEVFEECFEIVRYLKNSTIYDVVGAEVPKGILMEGPPGTGKTLLAKAIASESSATFISVSASEFIELYVGLGASKVRNLFRLARENSPSIVFIDEIDAVGRQRGAGINMGNDEREQTLNQMLAEMDGFSKNEGVIVIAATNRKDVLDSALLRPGRFDRVINVPLPDKNSRVKILGVHAKNKPMMSNIDYDYIAESTSGFSGAELKNIINEAAIYAARVGNQTISQTNVENAIEKSIVGIVKTNDTRNIDTRYRVAVHEMGHAILAKKYAEYFDLKKVTITSTYNGAGGYTLFKEKPEIAEGGLYTKDLLKKRIIISLGGKAAEFVYFGGHHVSVGATEDLKQANSLAQRMVNNYGMGKELDVFYNENIDSQGNPFLGRTMQNGISYSDKTKEKIDEEVLEIVNSAYSEAIRIVIENMQNINKYVDRLLNEVTLNGKDVECK
jgi:cell division protease FtsH